MKKALALFLLSSTLCGKTDPNSHDDYRDLISLAYASSFSCLGIDNKEEGEDSNERQKKALCYYFERTYPQIKKYRKDCVQKKLYMINTGSTCSSLSSYDKNSDQD